VSHFKTQFGAYGAIARYLIVVPALAGLFIGAPLLAREFEHGTHRLAWTQSVTRQRWLLAKTLLLSLATAAAALALAGISMWWRQPFDNLEGRMSPARFDIEGVVVPAYAVFALALGVVAGLLLRRTIPAMSVALGVFVAVRLGVEKLLRPHYLAPLHRIATPGRPTYVSDWVLQNSFVDAVGLETFKLPEVSRVIDDALRLGAISFDAVKHLLLCRIEQRPARLDLENYPHLPTAQVATTAAADYLALLIQAAC